MNESVQDERAQIWGLVKAERNRDRIIQGMSVGAWIVTFLVLMFLSVVIGMETWTTLRLVLEGVLGFSAVIQTLMPLALIVGTVSLLVATLSTVGVFLRFRRATLGEIRLRLTALEQRVSDQGSSGELENPSDRGGPAQLG